MGAAGVLTSKVRRSGALLEMHVFYGATRMVPGCSLSSKRLPAIGAGLSSPFLALMTLRSRRVSSPKKERAYQATGERRREKGHVKACDALRNGRVWQPAIIYLDDSGGGIRIIFPADPCCRAITSRFYRFGGNSVPRWRLCLAHGLFLATPTAGYRRNVAAVTLLAAVLPVRSGFSGARYSGALVLQSSRIYCRSARMPWTMPMLPATAWRQELVSLICWRQGGFIAPPCACKSGNAACQRCGGFVDVTGRHHCLINYLLHAER